MTSLGIGLGVGYCHDPWVFGFWFTFYESVLRRPQTSAFRSLGNFSASALNQNQVTFLPIYCTMMTQCWEGHSCKVRAHSEAFHLEGLIKQDENVCCSWDSPLR